MSKPLGLKLGRARSSLLSHLAVQKGMSHLHIPATLSLQQLLRDRSYLLPFVCRVKVKHGHRDGLMYVCFLYRASAVKPQHLPCPKESKNRLRSGVRRDSAISCPGVLGEGFFDGSLRLTEEQSKAPVQEESGDEAAPARPPQLNLGT